MERMNKKGFTLVELIVVIAIIGILAAVLIPSITGYINKARISNDTQDARNMTMIVKNYVILNDIDASQLEAPDVYFIVNSEDKNYTFNPRAKGGEFWYNRKSGIIEYANGGTTLYAAGSSQYSAIEDINGNSKLYLNATGELAVFLRNLRNVTSVQEYESLKEKSTNVGGKNLKSLVEKYDPSTTLYINSSNGFTTASHTNFLNKPTYKDHRWYLGDEDDASEILAADIVDYTTGNQIQNLESLTSTNTVVRTLDSLRNIPSFEDACPDWVDDLNSWIFESNNGGNQKYYKLNIQPQTNKIKNIVYSHGISIVPPLSLPTLVEVEGDITVPVSVQMIAKNAFTDVVGNTTLSALGSNAKVVDGAFNSNITTKLPVVSESVVYERAFEGNSLLKVYLIKNEYAVTTSWLGKKNYKTLDEALSEAQAPDADTYAYKEFTFDTTQNKYSVGKINCVVKIGSLDTFYKVGEADSDYHYYFDFSDFMANFPGVTSLDIQYKPVSIPPAKDGGPVGFPGGNGIDITIKAFDNSGLVLNVGITMLTA